VNRRVFNQGSIARPIAPTALNKTEKIGRRSNDPLIVNLIHERPTADRRADADRIDLRLATERTHNEEGAKNTLDAGCLHDARTPPDIIIVPHSVQAVVRRAQRGDSIARANRGAESTLSRCRSESDPSRTSRDSVNTASLRRSASLSRSKLSLFVRPTVSQQTQTASHGGSIIPNTLNLARR